MFLRFAPPGHRNSERNLVHLHAVYVRRWGQASASTLSYASRMSSRVRQPLLLLLALLAATTIACGAANQPPGLAPTSQPPSANAAATPNASPTAEPARLDIRARRLTIPALNIDAPVLPSRLIPDTSPPTPGCPPRPPGGTTLTVPNEGIATPEDALDGLENKAWIFGHSRWLNQPGLFYRLQDIAPGDELFVDGVTRGTGATVTRQRFVVDRIYLSDIDSGDALVTATRPEQIPARPTVILQTSVREDGAGKQWLLDQAKVMAKATNMLASDLNDPCKYLLLFVFARSS